MSWSPSRLVSEIFSTATIIVFKLITKFFATCYVNKRDNYLVLRYFFSMFEFKCAHVIFLEIFF